MTIQEAIAKAVDRENLSFEEAHAVATAIMEGGATDAQIAGLLVALRMKGETIEEVAGFARAMREKATPVPCGRRDLIDTCGTGGDRRGTFNVSTVSAFVVAGAGGAVAKHGNRSVSSQCGSADLFQSLGIAIDIAPDQMGRCVDEVGLGFLYAPALHPAMKHAIGPRREMGVRTLFNLLGPLTNPAGAKRQLLGVFSPEWTEPVASVLDRLGAEHVLVVHGDGLDEITLTGETKVTELKAGRRSTYTLHPEDFGFTKVSLEAIRGGDPTVNAQMTLALLKGEDKGPRRDLVLLNAGAAIYVSGLADSIPEGIARARESIDSGRAYAVLTRLQAFSSTLKPQAAA